jgi:hypothetical protein
METFDSQDFWPQFDNYLPKSSKSVPFAVSESGKELLLSCQRLFDPSADADGTGRLSTVLGFIAPFSLRENNI